MTLQEVAELKLLFNGKDVKNGLDEIAEQIDVLKEKQSQFTRADKEWQELNKEIKSLSASYKTVEERMDIQLMKTDQLRKYQRDLRKELGQKVGTDQYEPLKNRLTEVNTRMAQLKADQYQVTTQGQTLWQKWGSTIKGALAFGGALEVFNMLKGFGQGVIEEAQKFETASQSLRGEVTLTEEQFTKLKESSKETGQQFGMTGAEMMDAYNMIASGKSELVDIEGGIEAVTDAAITLATNGEMQLKPAAEGLTEVLNQFGAEADEAAKYVDIMSTGTQVGAGKIESITQALSYAGPMAKAAGLSFSETNAALQIFEQNGIKGQRAGTGLRGVLAELMKGADDTNPAVVGLQTAVENLSKKNLTAAEYTELFGRENVSAGIALVSSTDKLKDWTKQIEEGGGAAAMFAEKTKSSTFEQKKAEAEYANVRQELGEKLLPVYTSIYKGTLNLISGTIRLAMGLGEIPKFVKENKELFIALAVAIISLNTANISAAASAIAHAAAEKGRAIATKATTAAQWLMNAAMSANPIGLVIAALAALTGGLIWAYKNIDGFRAGVNATWAGLKTFISIIWDTYKALWSFDFSKVWDNLKNGWKKVTDSTTKAYTETMAEANKKVAVNNEAHREKELSQEEKKNKELQEANRKLQEQLEEANKALNDQKGRDNDAHRDSEEKKNKQKEEREKKRKEEQRAKELEENRKMISRMDEMWADSIQNELDRNKVKLMQKYEQELEVIEQSEADEKTKNDLILKLTEKLIADQKELDEEAAEEREEKRAEELERIKEWNEDLLDWTLDHKEKGLEQELKNTEEHSSRNLEIQKELIDLKYERDLAAIKKWKDDQLSNTKLTEEQKGIILEQYEMRRAEAQKDHEIAKNEFIKSQLSALHTWIADRMEKLTESQKRDVAQLAQTAQGIIKSLWDGVKSGMADDTRIIADGFENVIKDIASGDYLGAIWNTLMIPFQLNKNVKEEQERIAKWQADVIKEELTKTYEEIIKTFGDETDRTNISGIYGDLVSTQVSWMTAIREFDFEYNESFEGRLDNEIRYGQQIVDNYNSAVEKENEYSSKVIENIHAAYNEEVRRINEKYAILDSMANDRFNSDNLKIKENLNADLLGFITNESSKTSVVNEHASKRSAILVATALADKEIVDGMDQATIDAIMAARELRTNELAKLEDWYTKEIQFILSNEEQKRKMYSETEKLINDAEERIEQNRIQKAADDIQRNLDKNEELMAAEESKNALLETEAERHNTVLVLMAQQKDAALAASFEKLKVIFIQGYDAIIAKAQEAYNAGAITMEQLNQVYSNLQRIGDQLNVIRNFDGTWTGAPIAPIPDINLDNLNLPNYGSFGDGGVFPSKDPSFFENAGVLGGLRHNTPEGGNWVINPRTGRLLAKVEAGEFIRVYSRDMTSRMKGKLDKVNSSAIANTGVPVFASGGWMGVDGFPYNVNADNRPRISTSFDVTYTKVLEEKLESVVVELVNVQEYLSKIAESSDKTAKKPPLTVREISKGLNDAANLDRRSWFS